MKPWLICPLLLFLTACNTLPPPDVTVTSPDQARAQSLHRYINSLENKLPNWDEMTPQMVRVVRLQEMSLFREIDRWGSLRSIAYLGNGPRGQEFYLVTFRSGKALWEIGPLTDDGKVQQRGFRVVSD